MSLKSLALTGAMAFATAAIAPAVAPTAALADGHGSVPVMAGKYKSGTYLMDAHKMTLYIFDKGTSGVSNCYKDCAVKWPPLMGKAGMTLPKGYSLIKRKDGGMQIAHKGRPLYRWFKDKKPGDMTGDGVKGVWHTARP